MINKIKNIANTEDKKRLLSNFFSLSILQGMGYILSFITMPYLFRVLGAEKFGLIAFSSATILFLNVIVEYGFSLSATRDIATNKTDKTKLNEIYSLVLTTKLFLFVLSLIILSIVILVFEKFNSNWELFYLSYLLVLGNALFPIWFFQGIEEIKYISYFSIIAKVFFTLSIFIFVTTPEDYLLRVFLNSIGITMIGIYAIYFIRKKYNIIYRFPKYISIKNVLKKNFDLFITDFIPNLYNNFSKFFLAFFVSMETLGFYALATQLIDVFNGFVVILRNVTFPYLNNKFHNFKKISTVILIISFSFSLSILILSDFFIPFIFGEEAEKSLIYIYILAFSPFLLSLKIVYGINKMLIMKHDKLYRNITIVYSMIGFILSLILVPYYGALGAAWTLIITHIIMGLSYYIKSKNLQKVNI
jgi:polysaccharide transporter, PST family